MATWTRNCWLKCSDTFCKNTAVDCCAEPEVGQVWKQKQTCSQAKATERKQTNRKWKTKVREKSRRGATKVSRELRSAEENRAEIKEKEACARGLARAHSCSPVDARCASSTVQRNLSNTARFSEPKRVRVQKNKVNNFIHLTFLRPIGQSQHATHQLHLSAAPGLHVSQRPFSLSVLSNYARAQPEVRRRVAFASRMAFVQNTTFLIFVYVFVQLVSIFAYNLGSGFVYIFLYLF